MITFNAQPATLAQLLAANYTTVQLTKSGNQTASGNYSAVVGASATLAASTSSYPLTDVAGTPADWYEIVYTQAGGANPSASVPLPGYASDLCQQVRLLLGVDSTVLSDTTVQGSAFLPAALAHVRQRISALDTILASGLATGNDLATLALSALAHFTAALLCPAMTVLVPDMLQFDKWRVQRNRQLDWSATQQNLLANYELLISQANGEIAINNANLAAILPSAVVLAGPTRSGRNVSGGLFPLVTPPDLANPQPPYVNDIAPDADDGND